MTEPRLSKDGYRLRELIAEAGYEVTPDELADALDESFERVGPAESCGHEGADGRFGVCFQCATEAEQRAMRSMAGGGASREEIARHFMASAEDVDRALGVKTDN